MVKIHLSYDLSGRKTNHFEDDDLVDRLNYRYTVLALIVCILIITGETYVGKPINCWTPKEFSDTHNVYTNSICWLKGSYYLPTKEINIPDRSKPRHYYVSYYQWTPFILFGMAICFFAPRFLWDTFSRQSGFNIRRLVQTLKANQDSEKRTDFVKRVLEESLDAHPRFSGTICCGCRVAKFYAGMTMMCFTIKILYLINTLAQLFLLNTFLSFHFTGYNIEALKNFVSSEDWFESSRFPRVTMCDFMIRHLGSNQHWYAIQCNLPINIYNEKIFLGVWLWLIILIILNILSIFTWIISLTRQYRLAVVKKYLQRSSRIISEEKPSVISRITARTQKSSREKIFGEVVDYLSLDGFLIFCIVAHNTDEITARQIIEHLYTNFERRHSSPV